MPSWAKARSALISERLLGLLKIRKELVNYSWQPPMMDDAICDPTNPRKRVTIEFVIGGEPSHYRNGVLAERQKAH